MQTWLRRAGLFGAGAGFGLLTCLMLVRVGKMSLSPTPVARTSDAGPTIEQVRELAQLMTTHVEVSDCIVARLDGYTGGVEAAVLLRGDFELGVDLSAAKFEAVDATSHTAVLILPQPRVSQPRVDHRRSRVIAIRDKGLWTLVPGTDADIAVTNNAMRDAQAFVEQAANEPGLTAKSRQQAERVLKSFFAAIGWKIHVRWQAGS